MTTVNSEEALRALYGKPSERAVAKEQPRLDDHTRAFIAHAPFLVMGTPVSPSLSLAVRVTV